MAQTVTRDAAAISYGLPGNRLKIHALTLSESAPGWRFAVPVGRLQLATLMTLPGQRANWRPQRRFTRQELLDLSLSDLRRAVDVGDAHRQCRGLSGGLLTDEVGQCVACVLGVDLDAAGAHTGGNGGDLMLEATEVVEAEFGVFVQLASQCHDVVDEGRGGFEQVVHNDIMAEQGWVVGIGP